MLNTSSYIQDCIEFLFRLRVKLKHKQEGTLLHKALTSSQFSNNIYEIPHAAQNLQKQMLSCD